MGNCVMRSFVEVEQMMIKVVTSNGGIMELYAPITAERITNEFPGHALYQSPHHDSPPLLHNQDLHVGKLYYLLPLNMTSTATITKATNKITDTPQGNGVKSTCTSSSKTGAPYRMSLDNQAHAGEVYPRYNSTGVWKVKLVISPQQLSEILSQETHTEALIESVRTVAKCGNGVSSVGTNSDQWSISTGSWKPSSDKCAATEI